MTNNANTKRCSRCGQLKTRDEYYNNKARRDGLAVYCKLCHNDINKIYNKMHRAKVNHRLAKWRNNNRDRIRQQEREYRHLNPERHRQRAAKWKKNHPDKCKELRRRRYLANPTEEKRKTAEWRKQNPKMVKQQKERRRARKYYSKYEKINRDTVYVRDSGICYICKKTVEPQNWHLDHIVPLCRGGEHTYANVAVSHPKCNQIKAANKPSEAA